MARARRKSSRTSSSALDAPPATPFLDDDDKGREILLDDTPAENGGGLAAHAPNRPASQNSGGNQRKGHPAKKVALGNTSGNSITIDYGDSDGESDDDDGRSSFTVYFSKLAVGGPNEEMKSASTLSSTIVEVSDTSIEASGGGTKVLNKLYEICCRIIGSTADKQDTRVWIFRKGRKSDGVCLEIAQGDDHLLQALRSKCNQDGMVILSSAIVGSSFKRRKSGSSASSQSNAASRGGPLQLDEITDEVLEGADDEQGLPAGSTGRRQHSDSVRNELYDDGKVDSKILELL